MDINQLKSQLKRFGIKPNHRLGQNFLLSEQVLDKIVETAEIKPTETILEIGPGLGALTRKLAEKAKLVLAIEKDRKIAEVLHHLFRSKKNVKIISGDALFLTPDVIFNSDPNLRMHPNVSNAKDPNSSKEVNSNHSSVNSRHSSRSYKVVANIPYYITGKLLRNFLAGSDSNTRMHANPEGVRRGPGPYGAGVANTKSDSNSRHSSRPSLMVLLLQKEVAERIVAKPGNHSILSITTQFYADPEIVMYVPRDNFYPAPDVDSAVVKITPLPHPPHRGEGNENGSPSLDGRHPLLTSPSRGGEPGRFPSSRGGGRGRSRGDERPPSLDGTMSPPVFPSLDGRGKGRVVDEDKFFRLVKAGFAGKRKMLKNNLKSHTNLNVEKLLVDFGANPKARAQDLSLDDWKKLYDKVFNS